MLNLSFLCKFEGEERIEENQYETTVSPVEEDTAPSDLEAIMVDDFDNTEDDKINKWLR